MTITGSEAAERFLRVLFEGGAAGGLTDAELLERFLARDPGTAELAFAVLVERHGPLVQRVCRGVLRDQHLAEDAFQSTFLVLVQKASSLRVQATLAPWLHSVAVRVSRDARATAARRAKHERKAAELATTLLSIETDPREDQELPLQEELAKLAERHRRPIVLCDLQGLTHEQAAKLLGTPVGTIKSRLARGREHLRRALARRSLVHSESALPAILAVDAFKPELPTALVDRTARLAALAAEHKALTAAAIPSSVAILAQGALKSMSISRLKFAAAAVLIAASFVIGIGYAGSGSHAQDGPASKPIPRAPARPLDAVVQDLFDSAGLVRSVAFTGDGKFLIAATTSRDDDKDDGTIRLWDAKGATTLPPIALDGDPFAMAVAPDGLSLAVAVARDTKAARTTSILVVSVSSGKKMSTWTLKQGVDVWALTFTPDGGALAGGTGGLRDSHFYGEVDVWNVQTGEEIRSFKGHPNPVMSLVFSHDGHVLASASGTYGAPTGEVRLWEFESGRLLHTLTEPNLAIVTVAFSPDDKTLASGGTNWRETGVTGGLVTLWDVQTGKRRLTLPAFPSYVHAVLFAPTGTRLATASVSSDNDAKVTIWNSETGTQLETLPPGKTTRGITAVKCLAISPDGRTLAAGGASGMLRLWSVPPLTGAP